MALKAFQPKEGRRIDAIIVHCTATPPGMKVTVDDIDCWHKARGWKGIGYHYVVDLDGTVYRGRDKSVRLTASQAEAGLQHHAVTLTEVTTSCDDTLAWKREETALQSVATPEGKRRSRWWLWLLVGVAVGLAIGFHVTRLLSRR